MLTQDVVSQIVERVETKDRRVVWVVLLPEWRAFFDAALGSLAPPDGLRGSEAKRSTRWRGTPAASKRFGRVAAGTTSR